MSNKHIINNNMGNYSEKVSLFKTMFKKVSLEDILIDTSANSSEGSKTSESCEPSEAEILEILEIQHIFKNFSYNMALKVLKLKNIHIYKSNIGVIKYGIISNILKEPECYNIFKNLRRILGDDQFKVILEKNYVAIFASCNLELIRNTFSYLKYLYNDDLNFNKILINLLQYAFEKRHLQLIEDILTLDKELFFSGEMLPIATYFISMYVDCRNYSYFGTNCFDYNSIDYILQLCMKYDVGKILHFVNKLQTGNANDNSNNTLDIFDIIVNLICGKDSLSYFYEHKMPQMLVLYKHFLNFMVLIKKAYLISIEDDKFRNAEDLRLSIKLNRADNFYQSQTLYYQRSINSNSIVIAC